PARGGAPAGRGRSRARGAWPRLNPGSFSGLPRSGGDTLRSGRAERSADLELALQLLDDLEVLLPIEGHVEDVEVLLGQAHAAEAVGAVTEVVAHHQVGAVGAVLTLD